VRESGTRNPDAGSNLIGLDRLAGVHWNLNEAELYEHSIRLGECELAEGGALAVRTGQHTGRSPKDKYIVCDDATRDTVWWDGNNLMEPSTFETLLADFQAHSDGLTLYAQDLYGGARAENRISARVYSEYAWHALFIRNLLIRPELSELASYVPDLTIIDLPSFKADPARHNCRTETVIACDLSRKIVLIGGTSYAGEMKKSVFSVLNYLLPAEAIMPMHCSANQGPDGDVALFFGLSGTGKTTLSTDPARMLLGDDEHGWDDKGVFNFEGGCYAKTINLSKEAEPAIYATTQRFGTVFENVVLDENRRPDFDDGSLTENARCAYPIHFIDNASTTGLGGQPKNIIMLTCDAFGVLPPIARLTPEQAVVHFLSGYTAKVAGTEKGVTEPQATFSTCFGAPFIPRQPAVYGKLLRELIARHKVNCWLVNTGWTKGAYGVGSRMPISATRTLLSAALDGSLLEVPAYTDPNFGFAVPESVEGIEDALLHPRSTWADPAAYDRQAVRLVTMFAENFAQYEDDVDAAIRAAMPQMDAADE
jgi:phosphoenolpyruvate carboxykinase (ATP)